MYTQRIKCIENINKVTWSNESDICDPTGNILQLLRVNAIQESKIPAGCLIRDFVLCFARALRMDKVYAVTRTTDYTNTDLKGGYKQYIEYLVT